MTREEYLSVVEEQIRCKQVKSVIREELEAHMEDQKEAYIYKGKSEEEAELLAVKEMGDPVVTGQQLDKVHRPKTDWVLPLLAVGISIVGIIVQCMIFPYMDNTQIQESYAANTIIYNVIGIAVMLALFFTKYNLLGLYPWHIYGLYLIIMTVAMKIAESQSYYKMLILGNLGWMLFVPIFAGFVYRYREEKWKGIVKSIAILVLNWIIQMCVMATFSGAYFLVATFCCLITIGAAILKGLYHGNKARQIISYVAIVVGIPTAMLCDILWNSGKVMGLATYQIERIRAIFNMNEYSNMYGYSALIARQQISQASWFGGEGMGLLDKLPGVHSEYIITGIFSFWGIGAATALLLVIALFLTRAFRLSLFQKNRMGFLLGIATSSMLIVKSICYVCANFGWIPGTCVDMPFLSYGMCNTIMNYAYLGLILSVYRYTNVYTEPTKKRKIVIYK